MNTCVDSLHMSLVTQFLCVSAEISINKRNHFHKSMSSADLTENYFSKDNQQTT